MLRCCNSCGLEKTAHNMLLYKLNSHACQQFITRAENYFAALTACVRALDVVLSCYEEVQIALRVIQNSSACDRRKNSWRDVWIS